MRRPSPLARLFTAPVRRPRPTRLSCESLDDRIVPAVFYVSPAGNDSAAGSQTAPFRNIQQAVNAAGPSGDTVEVAAGTYTYNRALDVNFQFVGEGGVVSVINKSVTILGGFDAGFAASNPAANKTVIDGGGAIRGVDLVSTTTVGGAGLTMDGFTVQNGLAVPHVNVPGAVLSGDFLTFAFGGGLNASMANLSLSNTTFVNNTAKGLDGSVGGTTYGGVGAGGGLAFRRMAGTVTLTNLNFVQNKALGGSGQNLGGFGQGGGLLGGDQSQLAATNLRFDQNQAVGGTTNGSGDDPTRGGQADGQGGAVVLTGCGGTVAGVTATNNRAQGGAAPNGQAGGGFGGGLYFEQSNMTVADQTVRANTAQGGNGAQPGISYGGGDDVFGSTPAFVRGFVTGNTSLGGTGSNGKLGAPQGGGIAYHTAGPLTGAATATDLVVAGNQAAMPTTGGDTSAGGGGGGISVQGVSLNAAHLTVADNSLNQTSLSGSGFLIFGGGSIPNPTVNLSYSIVANQTTAGAAAIMAFAGSTVNYQRNLFFNNAKNDNSDGVPLGPVAGTHGTYTNTGTNFTGNPAFTSPGSANFDYGLQPTSAAIGQANGNTTATDAYGQPFGNSPDVGAIQGLTPAVPPATPPATPPASPPPPATPPATPPASPPPTTATAAPVVVTGDIVAAFTSLGANPRVTTADVNGDGVPDYIGASGPGVQNLLEVLDGKTRTLIATFAPFEPSFTGGVYVAAADLNRNGMADVVVTPDQGGGPVVAVYSGAGLAAGQNAGSQMTRFYGISDPNFRGGARPALGDLNRDGTPDLVVAAGFGGGPRIAIFNGTDVAAASAAPNRLVPDFYAFEDSLRNGTFVSIGDLNGDGYADLAFGGGPGGGPRVLVIDGRTLLSAAGSYTTLSGLTQSSPAAQLANFFSGDPNARDGVRVAVRDVFGTGTPALATEGGSGGTVHVYRAANLLANSTGPASDMDTDPMNGAFVG